MIIVAMQLRAAIVAQLANGPKNIVAVRDGLLDQFPSLYSLAFDRQVRELLNAGVIQYNGRAREIRLKPQPVPSPGPSPRPSPSPAPGPSQSPG